MSTEAPSTPIAVGAALPTDIKLMIADWSEKKEDYCGVPKKTTSGDVFKGKRVVLFGVPGAFTPTCHISHAPGYIEKFSEFAKYKIDTVACTCVNDVFVVGAWAKSLGSQNIVFLADGSGHFAAATGLLLDLREKGMGLRNQRFALIAEDGVVKHIGIGDLDQSGADAILKVLETGV